MKRFVLWVVVGFLLLFAGPIVQAETSVAADVVPECPAAVIGVSSMMGVAPDIVVMPALVYVPTFTIVSVLCDVVYVPFAVVNDIMKPPETIVDFWQEHNTAIQTIFKFLQITMRGISAPYD